MEKPLQIKGFQKETGHPLRYPWYQNWCPVMAEDEGFEFAKESPLVAKRPHLVSLSSDQFSKCTVCTIWNILRKPLKGKYKGNF